METTQIAIPDALRDFCHLSPCPVYAVGGLIRNALLGFEGGDLDVCGAYPIEDVCGNGVKFVPINKKLGTAEIPYKGFKFEYSRFRTERYDESGAHSPVSVSFDADLADDAKRRDFTVNAIYYDIKNDKIIDPLGGMDDIKTKTLRAHEAEKTFASDGLRLMRLCRFAAELGFEIESATYKTAKKFMHKLFGIAAERKRDELDKILAADLKYGIHGAHIRGVRLLYDLGLFKYILPSIEALDIPQNPKYHKYSVLEHTFKAVEYAPPDVRLAALMHDTGKPVSEKRDGNMYRHAVDGEAIVKRELGQSGLKYPNSVVGETAKLVALHMSDKGRVTGSGKMRLFCAENFDILEKLEKLMFADGLATGYYVTPPRFLEYKRILLDEGAPITVKDLRVDGNDALAVGLAGSHIKNALYALWRDCILDPKLNNEEWLKNRLTEMSRK
ncbi:MAG: HD domain-containing protein [Firmicutes bacterium]|nr:HD domain-containing protein [Bacillota bacterium]